MCDKNPGKKVNTMDLFSTTSHHNLFVVEEMGKGFPLDKNLLSRLLELASHNLCRENNLCIVTTFDIFLPFIFVF